MSQENNISIKISPEDVAAVQNALQTIETTLRPYLIALTSEERRQLAKVSDKTMPFVEKALDYARVNPQFGPAYLDVNELKVDVDAVYSLTQILRPIEQLNEGLNDTIMMAGSEAYTGALAYYNSVKQAAKINVPGAKSVHEDLSKRFISNGTRRVKIEEQSN